MEWARRASLSLSPSGRADEASLVPIPGSSVSVPLFSDASGDGMFSAEPAKPSGVSGDDIRACDEAALWRFTFVENVPSCESVGEDCDPLSSSGGHVVCVAEIAVGGETSKSVSSLGVGMARDVL